MVKDNFFIYPAVQALLSGGFLELLGFFIVANIFYRTAVALIVIGFFFSPLNDRGGDGEG